MGGAGHASEVCKRLSATGRFIGIDQDDAAIAAAGERLREFGERVTIIRSNYCNMVSRLQERGILGVDGILLDLGVSSYQLDTAERGFTYREDAPLDMRMDQRAELSAYDVVNGYSEEQLVRILRGMGCTNIAIDCEAQNCQFNESCKCTAGGIQISGSEACCCDDTKCSSFRCG